MSQQQLMPDPQSDDEGRRRYPAPHPYGWQTQADRKGAPRDEPPSTLDEPMVQHDYADNATARDYASPAASSSGEQYQGQRAQRRFEPDGDALEHGYRPYRNAGARSQIPPWARPQQQYWSPTTKLILFLVLGACLLGPALIALIIFVLISLAAAIVIVLPLLLVFLSFIFVVLVLVLRALGVPFGRGAGHAGQRRRGWW